MQSRTPLKSKYCFLLAGIVTLVLSCRSTQTPNGVPAPPTELLVSAASSLTDALNEIGPAFVKENPNSVVRFNFAASGVLQQQIEQGAPVDVFAAASPKEVDELEKGNFLEPASLVRFAGNRLVLIARLESRIKAWEDLPSAEVKKVALSNPDSVPSGRYAKETLTKRGLWTAVSAKAVLGENVRQTLSYVVSGDVDAGIVFATDAMKEKEKIRVVSEAVSGTDHKPIIYPAAVVAKSLHQNLAKRFVAFLQSPTTQAILTRYGFTVQTENSALPAIK